jgi:hypothetical protein
MRVRLIQPPSRAEKVIETGRQELFKEDMLMAIRKTIMILKAEGTVGMGEDNLWACTVSRIPRNHSPMGTNAAWVARQVFNEIVRDTRNTPINKFIL